MTQSHPSDKYNTLAIVSLVSGLLSWSLLPLIGTLVGIITGHLARAEIRRTREQGDTMAVIGLVLSWAQVLMLVGALAFVLLMFGGLTAFLVWMGWSSGEPTLGGVGTV